MPRQFQKGTTMAKKNSTMADQDLQALFQEKEGLKQIVEMAVQKIIQ